MCETCAVVELQGGRDIAPRGVCLGFLLQARNVPSSGLGFHLAVADNFCGVTTAPRC